MMLQLLFLLYVGLVNRNKIHNSLVTSWVHLASSLCTIGYKLVVANAIMKIYSIAVAMLDVKIPQWKPTELLTTMHLGEQVLINSRW